MVCICLWLTASILLCLVWVLATFELLYLKVRCLFHIKSLSLSLSLMLKFEKSLCCSENTLVLVWLHPNFHCYDTISKETPVLMLAFVLVCTLKLDVFNILETYYCFVNFSWVCGRGSCISNVYQVVTWYNLRDMTSHQLSCICEGRYFFYLLLLLSLYYCTECVSFISMHWWIFHDINLSFFFLSDFSLFSNFICTYDK